MTVDLLFRAVRSKPYEVDAAGFFCVDSPAAGVCTLSALGLGRKPVGTVKLLAKLALKRCAAFGIREDGAAKMTGVLALGYCKWYSVEPDAVVIGEIYTVPHVRGRGYA